MSAPLRDHRFSPCRHPFQSCCLGRKPCSRASGQLNSVGDYSNSVRIAHGPSRLDGTPYHRVRVSADGAIEWTHAHLGLTPRTTLAHQTYHALRWTILATGPGTCFTIDRTGHGVRVNRQRPRMLSTLIAQAVPASRGACPITLQALT
jgi:hypothetical protein